MDPTTSTVTQAAGELEFHSPINWAAGANPSLEVAPLVEELRRRDPVITNPVLRSLLEDCPSPWTCLWAYQVFYIRVLAKVVQQQYHSQEELNDVLDVLGQLLCQAVNIPQDCTRPLSKNYNESHELFFFTNFRSTQVYCCHTAQEKSAVLALGRADYLFHTLGENNLYEGLTYHQQTDPIFYKANNFIAWESIFPEGIDMEALSPRDVNVPPRSKQAASKPKAPPAKLTQKEKDHPPPPPEQVYEPASSDRPNGATYNMGRLLGRGGFAICYEGELATTGQKYALKIVKSHMPQKKMEQKFQTELQIHSKMRHANIVEFHRAFSYDRCTYIVLELCPNASLMDMVKTRGYISEPEVRFWTVQIAAAIKYMHERGIIHRDLKMGNIFLDKDMNVKVGDFGLAALLINGSDLKHCRRTTLCGTPNYIAPEILSKGKGGHDHAVDIWSLGIIIFAMLTGKPPFQSTTAEEIYRRAREREYDWPKLDTSENYISQETKDLVAELLQAPEDRPDPDMIVQHPFFTCGWMPQSEEMTPSLRERHPSPNQFMSIGMRGGRSSLYLRNLKKLCIKSRVGPWNRAQVYKTTYREVADEEKAGLTPKVPLAEDVVYRPFHEVLEERATPALQQAMSEPVEVYPMRLEKKPTTQSFAAQQRARPQASAASSSSRTVKSRQPTTEFSSRPVINIPTRPSKSNSRQVEQAEEQLPEPKDLAADVENRLAVDLVQQLNSLETPAPTISLDVSESLFNPKERLDEMKNTKPDNILAGLRRLQAELERALNTRTTAVQPKSKPTPPTIVVKWVDYTNKFGLGYILSNGSVGCIFKSTPVDSENPSKGRLPPCSVVVREAERHLQNRGNEAYADRYQIVPISGPNIEFYENRGANGFVRGTVNPQNYKVSVGQNGEVFKLAHGPDDWDNRKREKIMLWKKFANYMTAYGRDQNFPYDDALKRRANVEELVAAGNVVTFYQRWGDVGCWFFADGHFQFNFPDHTKIIISSDGTWCDFYHLPLEAARDFAANGTLPASALDDRRHLSYPVQTLLNFMSKPSKSAKSTTRKRPEIDPMEQGLPEANFFREKIQFIRLVVKEWVTNGGLGLSDMTSEGRLRWKGSREIVNVKVPYKHVWVTVGCQRGDERKVMWYNPRKPDEVIADVQ